MRTNIDIDDELLAKAMHAGPFTTKKDAVEAGLRMLARQAAYREILKWEGKLKWEGDESIDWTQPAQEEPGITATAHMVQEPRAVYRAGKTAAASGGGKQRKAVRSAGR
ncbi:MAG: type II toxin-antitoxin system VapB family antitoxin [Acidovorax sp.]